MTLRTLPFRKRHSANQSNNDKQAAGMAASIACYNFTHKPTDNFRHYNGPPKSKRIQKRKVDPLPYLPFIDMDNIFRSNSAGLGLVQEIARDLLKGGDEVYAPITIEDVGCETESEDELSPVEERGVAFLEPGDRCQPSH